MGSGRISADTESMAGRGLVQGGLFVSPIAVGIPPVVGDSAAAAHRTSRGSGQWGGTAGWIVDNGTTDGRSGSRRRGNTFKDLLQCIKSGLPF